MFRTLPFPVTDEPLALGEPTAALSPLAAEQKTKTQPEPDSGGAQAVVLLDKSVVRSRPSGNGVVISSDEVRSASELIQLLGAKSGVAVGLGVQVEGGSPLAVCECSPSRHECRLFRHSPTYSGSRVKASKRCVTRLAPPCVKRL